MDTRPEPVLDALGPQWGRKSFRVDQVFIVALAPDGTPVDSLTVSDAGIVFAPGINPSSVFRVEFDPIDYSVHQARQVHVEYRVCEGGAHHTPETVHFTTLEEFRKWYDVRRDAPSRTPTWTTN